MIVFITFAIAGVGGLMLLMLGMQIYAANNAKSLAKHRSKAAGLADLLNHAAMVDDGVIVGKNGSFMAAWLYQGEDNGSSTEEQRELVSVRINQALAGLGSGWMIHVDAARREAPKYSPRGTSEFPDPVSAAIDEERRRLFEGLGTMYEGFFVATVTYFPPMLAQRKFVELMFNDETNAPDKKAQTRRLVSTFKRDVRSIESRLSSAVKLQRLKGHKLVLEDGSTVTHDDFLRWLQFCVTGINQPVQLPSNPMYLDALIGGQELYTGVVPKLGQKFIQVVAIEGFPLESQPGILTALGELQCEYRWSNRFIFMDAHEAVGHLDKYRKKWKQKIRGFFDQVFNTNTGSVDQDAMTMVADAEAAIAEVNSGLVAQGYYTSVVVLMDESRARVESAARKVEKSINALGFAARIETINTMDAFLGSIPGHGVENVRRPLLNTLNLADLLPTSTIWTGEAEAPCPFYPPHSPPLMHCVTHGATPFRLNLHIRDLGHTLIFGPPGSGKSTFLGLTTAQLLRYAGFTVNAFDKGNSLLPLCEGVGGQHYTVGGDGSKLAFAPLQFLETKADRAWAMEFIDTLLALNGVATTPAQRNQIGIAILSMHQNAAKTMSEFCLTVQDESVREALKQYTIDGMMGHLLDAEQDGLALSSFNVFEIEELMNLGEKYALPVLLYLFRRIERALKGQPSAIILDEAWVMLGHPAFRAKIKEWLKVLRKANCIVIMATQNLSDAASSGILDVMVEATASKIFLPNPYARDEDASALYRRMGLNNRQIEILATAEPKRHYYYMSEKGRRLFDLALGPFALAFVGNSDKEAIATVQALKVKHGRDWVHAWLHSKGLSLKDYGAQT